MSELTELSEQLAKLLLQKKKQLAVAESCTGGWLAKCLTAVIGSSQWFDRGFVTYSNAAKQEMLGVLQATLELSLPTHPIVGTRQFIQRCHQRLWNESSAVGPEVAWSLITLLPHRAPRE